MLREDDSERDEGGGQKTTIYRREGRVQVIFACDAVARLPACSVENCSPVCGCRFWARTESAGETCTSGSGPRNINIKEVEEAKHVSFLLQLV